MTNIFTKSIQFILTVAAALSFGIWQHDVSAGFFMAFTLSIIASLADDISKPADVQGKEKK